MINVPAPNDAARIAAFLDSHLGWSAFWDKKHQVWRVCEDDPRSDLYAEHADARQVIAYATAHAQIRTGHAAHHGSS
jgi:hypothetical protein